MPYDPDRPSAHAESRGTDDELRQRAIERLTVVSLDGTLKGWDATFAASAVAQHERNGSLSDAQWKHVLRIARCAPLVHRPAAPAPARSESEREMDEVEAQLDAILRDPNGDRCVLANDEAGAGRAKSIARAMGVGPGGDGPLAGTPRLPEYGFALCGSCILSPIRTCPGCAEGKPHPGVECSGNEHSRHRNRICRGVAFYAHLQANILDARGDIATAQEVREDMGLVHEKKTSDRA